MDVARGGREKGEGTGKCLHTLAQPIPCFLTMSVRWWSDSYSCEGRLHRRGRRELRCGCLLEGVTLPVCCLPTLLCCSSLTAAVVVVVVC